MCAPNISIKSGIAEIGPTPWYNSTQRIDHRDNLAVMSQWFRSRKQDNKTLTFIIEGKTGSGKSVFGRVLEHHGHDVAFIDALEALGSALPNPKLDLTRHLPVKASIVIIDEVFSFDANSITVAVNHLLEQGMPVVFLVQTRHDLPSEITKDAAMATIDHNGLRPEVT